MHIGTGTTITFASGFFAEILDVTPPGPERKAIQSTHMGTVDAHTHVPANLVEWGSLDVEIAFDPLTDIPIDHAEESITITFPDSGDTTWTFAGFMTNFKPKVPLEDRMTATATIKVSGKVTVTA